MSTSKKASSSKSKRARSTIDPDVAYQQYLNNPELAKEFVKFSSKDVHQERFIKFPDFEHYPLEILFKNTGLFELFSTRNVVPCYPFLVRLFYTNMSYKTNYLKSMVKNVPIKLTPKKISDILNIPNTGATLSDIEMTDPEILASMLEDGQNLHPPIYNRVLRPLPRLIGRILSHNILQKSGSFTYISLDLAKFIYAVMGDIQVNWALVIYNNLLKKVSSTLDHGCVLTHIFKAFDVPIHMESDIASDSIPFNRGALARMKIPHNPNEHNMDIEEEEVGEDDDNDEDEEEEAQAQHQEQSLDYAGITSQFETLTTNQTRILETQDRLVASHYVMQYQLSQMRESQDAMRKSQEEFLRYFHDHFPPNQ